MRDTAVVGAASCPQKSVWPSSQTQARLHPRLPVPGMACDQRNGSPAHMCNLCLICLTGNPWCWALGPLCSQNRVCLCLLSSSDRSTLGSRCQTSGHAPAGAKPSVPTRQPPPQVVGSYFGHTKRPSAPCTCGVACKLWKLIIKFKEARGSYNRQMA